MNKKRYYFNDFNEDNELCSLAQIAKDTLKHMDSVANIYRKYNDELYGQAPEQFLCIESFRNEPLSSSDSMNSFGKQRQHRRDVLSSETSIQAPTTSVSSLPRKYYPFDIEGNESPLNAITSRDKQFNVVLFHKASNKENETQKHLPISNTDVAAMENVTTSESKQLHQGKWIQLATDQENSTEKLLSVENTEESMKSITSNPEKQSNLMGVSFQLATDQKKSTLKKQLKQLTPMKVIQNDIDPQSLQHQDFLLNNKRIHCMESLNFESEVQVGQESLIISSKETDQETLNPTKENDHESDSKYICLNAQRHKISKHLDVDNGKHTKSVESANVCILNDKNNSSSGNEVKIGAIPCTHEEGNLSFEEHAKFLNNKIHFIPDEETTPVMKPINDEINFSSGNTSKMHDPVHAANVQASIVSDGKIVKMPCPEQHSKMNSCPNQGEKVLPDLERKNTTTLFKSSPIIQSSEAMHVETEISGDSEIIINSSSPSSPIDNKNDSIITNNVDEKKLPEDIHSSIEESKNKISEDLRPLSQEALSTGPNGEKLDNAKKDVISLVNDSQSCKPSVENLPPSNSCNTITTSKNNSVESDVVISSITQLRTTLQMRDKEMSKFFNFLLNFLDDLKFLYSFIRNIQHVVHNISIKKICHTKEYRENLIRLGTLASKLIQKIGSWKTDVDLEIPIWTKYLRLICKNKTQIEALKDQPPVAIKNPKEKEKDLKEKNKENEKDVKEGKENGNKEDLKTQEKEKENDEDLKAEGKKMDDMLKNADSRRWLFLSTANDIMKLMNRFVDCLVFAGILSPSPTSKL